MLRVALLMCLFVLCVACLTVFGETIRNVFGCGCYFVIECYGCVCALLNRPCMVFQRVCVLYL